MINIANNRTYRDETSKHEVGCKTSKFLSMVLSFLEENKDVQRMAQLIMHEEEKKRMLIKEVKIKMEKATNQLTMENRSSGF